MKQEIKGLIETALEMFEQTTGLKAAYQGKLLNETRYPDGLVRIDHQNMQWIFALQAKTRVTRATVAIEKTEGMNRQQERLLVTDYVTPPMADLMKKMDIFFMDTAGNAYINKLPLYVFIKGNKLHKANDGDVEILKLFRKFKYEVADQGIAPPLLVYADLIATGDDRNIETAGIIYDKYLVRPDRQDR